jgi:hypothetical protein
MTKKLHLYVIAKHRNNALTSDLPASTASISKYFGQMYIFTQIALV